jgi:spore protease
VAVRTDLALEAQAHWQETAGEQGKLSGVRATTSMRHGISMTQVEIMDPQGAQALGKPEGRYLTLETGRCRSPEEILQAAEVLGEMLGELMALGEREQVLVVGLGNPAVTPDALGPRALEHLLVTRHLVEGMPDQFGMFRQVSALAPGVLGTTGLESVEVVRGVVARVKPDRIIVIDALAARDPARLCGTIQLSDTGIVPGSGIGNSREAFDKRTLGVPVASVGVPTVVDAATLIGDCLEKNGLEMDVEVPSQGLVVTPSDIDASIGRMARILGVGISRALHPGHSAVEIENYTS